MKKLICTIISFMLILSFMLPASATVQYSSSDKQKAMNQFRACAYSSEYGGSSRDYIHRWKNPIRIFVSGSYTDQDVAFLYRFLTDLKHNVDGLPEISLTGSHEDANIYFYFAKLNQLDSYLQYYYEGNWGCFTYWNSGYDIVEAEIGIATDVTNQKQRNHLIMEELVGALGFANDHYIDKKSILYRDWTEYQALTTADWLMLCFLYDTRVPSGSKWPTVENIISRYY